MTDQPLIHCNPEVLHAPGVCDYCDEYPDRQAARAASGGGFTPPEANGWRGNVAQRKLMELPPDPIAIEYDGHGSQPSLRQRLRDAMGLR